jgi:hypothetical protein
MRRRLLHARKEQDHDPAHSHDLRHPYRVVAALGCADKILSDDRIRDSTALALNMPPKSVVISDRQYDGMMSTYYTASTRRGVYRCRISGGSVNMLGMTDPPDCSRR